MSKPIKVNKADVDRMKQLHGDNFTSPNFNGDHNKKVVEDSIKKYEALRKKKMAQYTEGLNERTDAVATYLKSLASGQTTLSADQYFGQQELARLAGRKIYYKIMEKVGGKPVVRIIQDESS